MAEKAMEECASIDQVVEFFSSWTSNYQRAAYIDTGITKRERSIISAKEMADEHQWEFQRLAGDLSLLKNCSPVIAQMMRSKVLWMKQ